MSIYEEVQFLRKELRVLRQGVERFRLAWHQQKARADRLEQENGELRIRFKLLEKEHTALQAKLGSTTSHKNKLLGMIFKTNVKKDNDDRKRSRGGQAGHTGQGREKPKEADQEKTVYLSNCPDCGNVLRQTTSIYKRTVEDIPPPQKIVTRYYLQRQWCSFCAKEVHAVPNGTLEGFRIGLNAIILILFLKYRLRTPLQKIGEALREQYALKLTSGGIQDILHRLKKRFGKKYETIINEIRHSPLKHADETGWRVEGVNSWCWLFASQKATYYTIEETRGKGVPEVVLGHDPPGVLVRDDFKSYESLEIEQQSCWVHLLRVSREAMREEGASKEVKTLHAELKELFYELRALVESRFHKRERARAYELYRKRLQAIEDRDYHESDSKKVQARIRRQGENLLTALKYEGVPLTNNHAERQIRPMVVTRKISGGSRSPEGAGTHAVNMSITQTVLLEGKNFFTGIKELLRPTAYQYVLENTE